MGESTKIGRAIDANLNRFGEAIRVIEDCLRFVIEDTHLAELCKRTRHAMADWKKKFGADRWIDMRDADADVGRHNRVADEYVRDGLDDILQANFARALQSVRCLEEFSKTIDDGASTAIEKIRYQVYSLERSVLLTTASCQRMRDVHLYVLIDGRSSEREFIEILEHLIDGEADAIQLRDSCLTDRELLRRATAMVELCHNNEVVSIINNRADLAAVARCDGVHLGQDDLPVNKARQIVGSGRLIGVSTHTLQQARQAVIDGANYIGVGPTFPSTTKEFESLAGTEFLQQVANEISMPAFAIGGIHVENLDQVLDAGIRRIAVSGAVLADPQEIAANCRRLKSKLVTAVNTVKTEIP